MYFSQWISTATTVVFTWILEISGLKLAGQLPPFGQTLRNKRGKCLGKNRKINISNTSTSVLPSIEMKWSGAYYLEDSEYDGDVYFHRNSSFKYFLSWCPWIWGLPPPLITSNPRMASAVQTTYISYAGRNDHCIKLELQLLAQWVTLVSPLLC